MSKYVVKIFYPTSHIKCLNDSVFQHRDSSSYDLRGVMMTRPFQCMCTYGICNWVGKTAGKYFA